MSTKRRIALRGWCSRATKSLTKLVSENADKVALQEAIAEFDKRLEALDSNQEEVEVNLEGDELLADIETAADFRDECRQERVAATRLLATLTDDAVSVVDVDARSSSSHVTSPSLPKIELPTFSGDVTKWISFWDQFVAIIDNSDLPEVSKFVYLQSLLSNEAKSAIKGLTLSVGHYQIAKEILLNRFGRKERIIFTHIQQLMAMQMRKTTHLSKLQDELMGHVRCLEVLGVTGDQYGVILTPLILSQLPQDVMLEWAREGEGHESDLDWLLKFLSAEIHRRERSLAFKVHSTVDTSTEAKTVRVSSASALQSSSSSDGDGRRMCASCDLAGHSADRCWKLTKLSLNERKSRIQHLGLCFRCLNKGHIAKGCMAKCRKCKGRHHEMLCNPKPTDVESRSSSSVENATSQSESRSSANVSHAIVTSAHNPHMQAKHSVVLQTTHVEASGLSGKSSKVNVLFDTGSDRSYITSKLVKQIEPGWAGAQHIAYSAFGSQCGGKNELRNMFQVQLACTDNSSVTLLATEIPNICAPVCRPQVPHHVLRSFGELSFAIERPGNGEVQIDILIGLDNYWRFMKAEIVSKGGLVAQNSLFGWILSGSLPDTGLSQSQVVSHQLLCFDVSDTALHRFWDLESIGIYDDAVNSPDVAESFRQQVRFVNGRYEVGFPWKSGMSESLLNNEKLARTRLAGLSKRLGRDPDLACKYNGVLQVMEQENIIEEVPREEVVCIGRPTYYMPHRPVIKESSTTTKVRPVFDASAPSRNGISLNDCLEAGPNLIPSLPEILLRFRRWKVALTADITKAFLQVSIREVDRDVSRFLWDVNGDVRVMRFTRVPFGNKSSPFLLNATIKYHLDTYPSTKVVRELQTNLYVDDWLSGADSDAEGCDMLKEADHIMSQAGMSFCKWSSNSPVVANLLHRQFNFKYLETDCLKVLGMRWSASSDHFSFDCEAFPQGLVITKRLVLSVIARIFDPLGMVLPFTMFAKCLFQDIWRLELDWNESIPDQLMIQFRYWMSGMDRLREWKIPRSYTGRPWCENDVVTLHAFGDASEKAYGACVYLVVCFSDGSSTSSLVISRARVAPVKKVTLPRLELLSALLCARLVTFVKSSLQLPTDVSYHCWLDSMVALAWIKSDAHRWKTFVANRVTCIQQLTDPMYWSHCPGKDNPADLVTRGVFAEQLVTSETWLQGPAFLTDGSVCCETAEVETDVVSTEQSSVTVSVDTSVSRELVFEVDRWGSFTKSIRVVGWVLRFIHNIRSARTKRMSGSLSLDELTHSKLQLILSVQRHAYADEIAALKTGRSVSKSSPIAKLSPFLSDNDLLRVGGRIQFSKLSYEEKHPIILPKSHVSMLLVRSHHRMLKHAGVVTMVATLRCHYWIVGLRRLAKAVKRECVACQRQDAVPGAQPMAPLPGDRVTRSPPFNITGIDHAGPLYCSDFPKRKFYVLLFTCAVIRAVHLELVNSMSLIDTMLAIRRFVARRGLPSVIYSDNAKSFIAAQGKMISEYGHLSPQWKYIAPRSPWWGGWWERLVQSVKKSLKRSLGSSSLARSELETILHEIEACLNSRPLTFVGDEVDAEVPLTPAHFLGYKPVGIESTPVVEHTVRPIDLAARSKHRNELLEYFWDIWSTEYIRNLPVCRGSVAGGRLTEGSMVLVREDGHHRLQWPLGIVTKVYPGRDGVVRTVQVRTTKGTYTRSIQLLHELELSDTQHYTTRFGRTVKPVYK